VLTKPFTFWKGFGEIPGVKRRNWHITNLKTLSNVVSFKRIERKRTGRLF
jgi:hypothetical protein